MKFYEPAKEIISFPKYEECFIYFLIDGDEVVYVGQTRNGVSRPLSHKDKKFNEIKILYCDKEELDYLEDFYIEKYKPSYNKQRNYAVVWSLHRVRDKIREIYEINDFTVPRLKRLLKKLNIEAKKDVYTSNYYITFNEYETVINYLEENFHEIHN